MELGIRALILISQKTRFLRNLNPPLFQDILTEVHLYVMRLELPQKVKIHLLIKMSELEHRLHQGANEKIQLGSLLSAFQVTRDMIKADA